MTVRVVGETFQLYNEDSEKPSRENVQTTLFFFFFFDKKKNKETKKQRENQCSNLVSKSHTQFCQADSYCSSATYNDKNKFVSR